MSQMKLKKSTVIFNDDPALFVYPLLSVITMLAFVWFFPYIKIYKFLVHDWLSFVPSVVKVCFALMTFYLALHYVMSFFRAALIAASVLRIEKTAVGQS